MHELTGLLGEPQNLVSYHLGRLREASLVFARRSTADRRDTYYSADLERLARLLSTVGGALHPALRLAPVQLEPFLAGQVSAAVLFVCSGNSARSPMAEALTRSLSGGAVEAVSAGSQPKPLHPMAVRVMRDDFGLDIAAHAPKHLSGVANRSFDRVISLCDRVREVCPPLPGRSDPIHWSIPNPATDDYHAAATLLRFRRTAAELATRVRFLLATLARPIPN